MERPPEDVSGGLQERLYAERGLVDEEHVDEHAGAGHEPVPDEGVEGVALDELEEKDDAQVAEDRGGDDANGERRPLPGRDAVFRQVAEL